MPKSNNFSTNLKKKNPQYQSRIVIEKISPEIDGGLFPVKRTVGENVVVRANVFADGHDEIYANLIYRKQSAKEWKEVPMKLLGNDRWIGSFAILEEDDYLYSVRGYVDEFGTWLHNLEKKIEADQDIKIDIAIGKELIKKVIERVDEKDLKNRLEEYTAKLESSVEKESFLVFLLDEEVKQIIHEHPDIAKAVTYYKELRVRTEPVLARFSSWYEFFPRSWAETLGKHGTFKDSEKILPEIARMGFDIIYLPPIHPIGHTKRKGPNNSVDCKESDPGCPWAIGSEAGGHKSIHPDLGSMEEFEHFVKAAKDHHLEVALDLAYQCSPDHPYVKEHPQWFKWRPDGTVQYAENPPKKYEDVLPINFETEDAKNLWDELKSIVIFWREKGVRVFRVDNPHTKPFVFWDWLIAEVTDQYPDTIFLSEAFTCPNVMYRLAKGGFSQSYTYFTWRNTKKDFIEYLTELTKTEVADYLRPNFWPNTPDILPEHLQYGGRPAFMMRAIMASTLSSNFGIYGPAFELCVSAAVENKEEYLDSEKYEIKKWNWDQDGNLKDLLSRLNKIRKENPALQITRNIRFCEIDNDQLLAYYKATPDYSNIILVIVNLDPFHTQIGHLVLPLEELCIEAGRSYLAHDLLSEDKYIWQNERNYIELDPQRSPAHIFLIKRHVTREQDFDYFL